MITKKLTKATGRKTNKQKRKENYYDDARNRECFNFSVHDKNVIEAIPLYVLNRCCFGRIVGFSTESRSSDPSASSMILYPTIHGSHDIPVLTTPKILLK